MKKLWDKLKLRWGIENNLQVAVILLVFAVTGFSFLYINPFIDHLLGIEASDPFWIKALVFIVIVLPVYNVLLIFWGTLFGQYRFFRNFVVRFFKRITFRNK